MTNKHKRIAVGVTLLAALLPGLVALQYARPTDFSTTGALLNFLGRLAGILGLSGLLVAAVISCRIPGFDRFFGGLTKLWHLHHWLGAGAFLLILLHPVLLALGAAPMSLNVATQTLFPDGGAKDGDIWSGWVALVLTMVFMVPTFSLVGGVSYQRWKLLHRVSAAAIVVALAHNLIAARTLPSGWNIALWWTLAVLVLASVGYRLIFSRWWGRLPYRVDEVTFPANNAVELTLQPQKRHLRYQAGQFVYLTPKDRALQAGVGEEHPYTLTSAPDEECLRLVIKDLGDASRALQEVATGTLMEVEGPYGDFFAQPEGPLPELWIAGGIGITPFLGRLRELALNGEKTEVQLLYCVQDESRAMFYEELCDLERRIPGFRLTPHYFYRNGPLDRDFLLSHCPEPTAGYVRICGPVALIALARSLTEHLGVARRRVITEEFQLL